MESGKVLTKNSKIYSLQQCILIMYFAIFYVLKIYLSSIKIEQQLKGCALLRLIYIYHQLIQSPHKLASNEGPPNKTLLFNNGKLRDRTMENNVLILSIRFRIDSSSVNNSNQSKDDDSCAESHTCVGGESAVSEINMMVSIQMCFWFGPSSSSFFQSLRVVICVFHFIYVLCLSDFQ